MARPYAPAVQPGNRIGWHHRPECLTGGDTRKHRVMEPPRSTGDFPVLGRPLSARIRSPQLDAWVRQHWHRPQHALADHAFALNLIEHEALPRRFEGEPEKARLLAFDVPFTIVDAIAEHRERDSGVRLDLDARGAAIRSWGVSRLGGEGSGQLDRFWGALLVAFHEALRASGLLPFHAAVVVRDGRATMLTGPSGAGKSTTLLRAVRAGDWAILAEDLSWLDPNTLRLYGWDSGLRLWPDSIEQFAPDLTAASWRTDANGKQFLPWDAFDAPLYPTARLDTILLLGRDGGADRPIRSPEALKTLWEATGLPLLPTVRRHVATKLAGILGRIRFGRHQLGQSLAPLG